MAASNATMIATGRSGNVYSLEVYVPDAIATQCTMNPAGLATATSAVNWRVPEDVVITDISILAAPTAVGATFTQDGAAKNGATIRWNNMLESLSNRVKIGVSVPKGSFVGLLQF